MKSIQLTVNNETYTINESAYDPISGAYLLNFEAPDTTSYSQTNHYYPMQLDITDDNDNVLTLDDTDQTFGDYLKLRVRETEFPVLTLLQPEAEDGKINVTDGSLSVVFSVTDTGDSGLDDDSIILQFGDNVYHLSDEEIEVTVIDNGYRIEFSPTIYLSDGDYPLNFKASDNDENEAVLNYVVIANEGNVSFVFNRTLVDVNRVKFLHDKILAGTATSDERLEYSLDMKGARNRSDFVRIIGALKYICNYYEVEFDEESFEIPDIPRVSFIQMILDKIDEVRNDYPSHNTTPATPNVPLNTYIKMNNVEKILYDIWSIIKSIFFYYCDTGLYADGEIGLLE